MPQVNHEWTPMHANGLAAQPGRLVPMSVHLAGFAQASRILARFNASTCQRFNDFSRGQASLGSLVVFLFRLPVARYNNS